MDEVVIPALRAYQPDIILVASGVDPNILDPLSRSMVTSKGFAAMTQKILAVADEVCGGKLVALQEGGYSPTYSPVGAHWLLELKGWLTLTPQICIHRIVSEMAGTYDKQDVQKDPYVGLFEHMEQFVGSFTHPTEKNI